jgi:hypothetical protein
MFTRNTCNHSGLLDITIEQVSSTDPEGCYYKNNRPWVILRNSEDLIKFDWNSEAVVCVCIEALREKCDNRPWRKNLNPMFFVLREMVENIPTGKNFQVLNSNDRFRLRDIAGKYRVQKETIYR